ncbi:unnamed protein product, partial [marine sediment metagenome]
KSVSLVMTDFAETLVKLAEEGWNPYSTYRGIDIWVWLPEGTPYGCYLDSVWYERSLLFDLYALIDDFLEPEPHWEYHSTYRGIDIEVYMPDGTPYRAYFDGSWHTATSLSTLQAAIDDFIEPEPEPYWAEHSYYRDILIWVWMPDGTPYAAYFGGDWHYEATLSAIKAAIDAYLGPEPEPPPSLSMDTPTWPSSPQPAGAYLPVTLHNIYNSGGAGDNCVAGLFDGATGEILDLETFSMETGELIDSLTLYFTMPNRTIGVVAMVGYDTHYTDSESTVIQLEEPPVEIPTSLTLSAPDKVGLDEKFVVSGILYETDSGIPIPNQPINHSYDGRSLGSSTTGVDGDYLKEVSVPESGVWTIRSDFLGTETLQA